jgi:hypothetical protein
MSLTKSTRFQQFSDAHREARNARQRERRTDPIYAAKARACEAAWRVKNRQRERERRRRDYQLRREAESIAWKRYYQANKSALQAYYRAKSHFRRLKGWDTNLRAVKQAMLEVLESYRIGSLYLDAYSGQLIAEPSVDHIVPLSAGGNCDADNLCVTSLANNQAKNDKPLLIWMATR